MSNLRTTTIQVESILVYSGRDDDGSFNLYSVDPSLSVFPVLYWSGTRVTIRGKPAKDVLEVVAFVHGNRSPMATIVQDPEKYLAAVSVDFL